MPVGDDMYLLSLLASSTNLWAVSSSSMLSVRSSVVRHTREDRDCDDSDDEERSDLDALGPLNHVCDEV
jgi:hypothetical protein